MAILDPTEPDSNSTAKSAPATPTGGNPMPAPQVDSVWKTRAVAGGVLALALLAGSIYSIRHDDQPPAVIFTVDNKAVQPTPLPENEGGTPSASQNGQEAEFAVHVVGRVHNPGLYRMPPGSRVRDALDKAGGPLSDADTNHLNLAAYVEDAMRIEVPRTAEAAQPDTVEPQTTPALAATPTDASTQAAQPTPPPVPTVPVGPVNINTAGQQELEALPGIGPKMAQRILDYRVTNGAFASVDELVKIQGIGNKNLEKLRPFIVVR